MNSLNGYSIFCILLLLLFFFFMPCALTYPNYIKMVENDLDFRVCPEASTGDKGNIQILVL